MQAKMQASLHKMQASMQAKCKQSESELISGNKKESMEGSSRILWSWVWGLHTAPAIKHEFHPASFAAINSWIHQSPSRASLCMTALWQRSYWLHRNGYGINTGMLAMMELHALLEISNRRRPS